MANPADNKPLSEMTDREILVEIAENMRVVNQVVESLADHPMIAALANGQSPMAALMGR